MQPEKKKLILLKQGEKLRAVFPLNASRYFFLLYTPFTFKARVWAVLLKLAFRLRLASLFTPQVEETEVQIGQLSFYQLRSILAELIGVDLPADLILLLPYDLNRSRVCGFLISHQPVFFKAAWSSLDSLELRNEVNAIKWLEKNKWEKFDYPVLIKNYKNHNMVINIFNALHCSIGVNSQSGWNSKILNIWREIRNSNQNTVSFDEVVSFLHQYGIDKKYLDIISKQQHYQFCSAHGDFAPWNMKTDPSNKMWLFDWENFKIQMPYLFDPLHFFIQTEYLVKKKSPEHISKHIPKFVERIGKATFEDVALSLIFLRHIKKRQPHFMEVQKIYLSTRYSWT